MAVQKEPTRSERFKAYAHVFDHSTLRTLFKLSGVGYFDGLIGPIKIGKEAHVFSASKGKDKVCVKVYRIAANFKKMYDYMAQDPRFSSLKRNKMVTIFAWARKEYRNLLKAWSVRISVPKPIAVRNNVLVMEFIGDDMAALRLVNQKPKNLKKFYNILFDDIKRLYHDAKLVHADLSAFNILVYKDKPVIIDMSHAINLKYPGAMRLLKRDLRNVCRYFNKQGLKLDYEKEFEKCIAKR